MIETFVLTGATITMVMYIVVSVRSVWADRPLVGRGNDGLPRPAREVRRKR